MIASEIQIHDPELSGSLSLRQDKMLGMLKDLHSTLTGEEVRSINPIQEEHGFSTMLSTGMAYLSEKANLIGDVEESIRHLQRFHKTLSEDVRAMCCDPGQLVLGFEKDSTRMAVAKAYDEAREIATRIFQASPATSTHLQISLP